MKKFKGIVPVVLCIVFVASLISCGFSSKECTGEIVSGGKKYTSKAKNPDDAKRFACNKYCLDTDAKCDAMYGIWVASPKGKAAGSPPKMRALSEDKQLLDCVTIECAGRCLADIAAGRVQVKVKCN